jgi:hypothetical protein
MDARRALRAWIGQRTQQAMTGRLERWYMFLSRRNAEGPCGRLRGVRLLAHRHRHQRPATRQPLASRKLATIEGNTNGKGERDSVTGDGVWVKERVPTLAKSYIRIFS